MQHAVIKQVRNYIRNESGYGKDRALYVNKNKNTTTVKIDILKILNEEEVKKYENGENVWYTQQLENEIKKIAAKNSIVCRFKININKSYDGTFIADDKKSGYLRASFITIFDNKDLEKN